MNTYYIKIRGDGQTGLGTLASPWDGSTAPIFDNLLLNAIPASIAATNPTPTTLYNLLGIATPCIANIILDSGNYQTSGWNLNNANWPRIRSGWNISGSGIDQTFVKLVGARSGYLNTSTGEWWVYKVFTTEDSSFSLLQDNVIIQSMTLDSNLNGQVDSSGIVCGAISMRGNNVTAQNVKCINWGCRNGSENFVISAGDIDHSHNANTTGAYILNCIVSNPATGYLGAGGNTCIICGLPNYQNPLTDLSGYCIGATLSGCTVDGTPSGTITDPNGIVSSQGMAGNGFTIYGLSGLAINNVVKNVTHGCYQDTWRNQNVTVINNILSGVSWGIHYELATTTSTIGTGNFLNNRIYLRNSQLTNIFNYFVGITMRWLYTGTPDYASANKIVVSGNYISMTGNINAPLIYNSSNTATYGIILSNTLSGSIINNTIDNLFSIGDSRSQTNLITTGTCKSIIMTGNLLISNDISGTTLPAI